MTDKWNDFEVIDSTEYHDGRFRFEVSAEHPTSVALRDGYFAEFHSFFNDSGTITLNGSADEARRSHVGGTLMNDYLIALEGKLAQSCPNSHW